MADKSTDMRKGNATCHVTASNWKGAQRTTGSAHPFQGSPWSPEKGERVSGRNQDSLEKSQQVMGQGGRYSVEAQGIAANHIVACTQMRGVLPRLHLSQDFGACWPPEQYCGERGRSLTRLPRAVLNEGERNTKVTTPKS